MVFWGFPWFQIKATELCGALRSLAVWVEPPDCGLNGKSQISGSKGIPGQSVEKIHDDVFMFQGTLKGVARIKAMLDNRETSQDGSQPVTINIAAGIAAVLPDPPGCFFQKKCLVSHLKNSKIARTTHHRTKKMKNPKKLQITKSINHMTQQIPGIPKTLVFKVFNGTTGRPVFPKGLKQQSNSSVPLF